MFEKYKLRKKIRNKKKLILTLEARRARSQAALVEAILTNSVPDDKDVDFFNDYTSQIDAARERMHNLQKQLDEMGTK
ncbi:MAG: hypothetical protein J5760_05375 [Clostridia bacterium]|nr:hypothetical protein [Clostridia bacterium]